MPIGIRLSIVIEIPDSENDSMGNLSRKINEDPKKYLSSDFVKIGGARLDTIVSGGGEDLLSSDYDTITEEIEKAEGEVDFLECKRNGIDTAMMEYIWEGE